MVNRSVRDFRARGRPPRPNARSPRERIQGALPAGPWGSGPWPWNPEVFHALVMVGGAGTAGGCVFGGAGPENP